ncbi:Protein of unknown function [Gryllus bimaculatus]|nr:Protein of unknown function [Gryllus bimaculatus]
MGHVVTFKVRKLMKTSEVLRLEKSGTPSQALLLNNDLKDYISLLMYFLKRAGPCQPMKVPENTVHVFESTGLAFLPRGSSINN